MFVGVPCSNKSGVKQVFSVTLARQGGIVRVTLEGRLMSKVLILMTASLYILLH